jgi:hypothetical protein
MKRIHALITAAALVAALAACTPMPPEPTPTMSETAVKPTPKPTPTVTLPPLAIPDCETLLPLATAKDLFSENTELLAEPSAGEFVGRLPVPSIPVVLSTANPSRACVYGIPQSDGYFELVVAGITDAQRATLEGELAASGFSQTTMGTVTAFELEGENEVGSVGTTHIFTGDVWIVCDGTSLSLSGVVTGSALDALRTANPALAL